MLIDTHAHLNFEAFSLDWKNTIERCLSRNIWIINVGSKYETSRKAVEIAENYESGVFAAIGLHPIHAQKGIDEEAYKKLAGSKKVVAIGEIGLDYFRDYGGFKKEQREVFLTQIELAVQLNLPIIFHCRKAFEDLIKVIKNNHCPPGVVHCFTGTWKQAQEFLEMGFFLGINGIIYKLNMEEVIKKTSLDRLLLETDCPYLGVGEGRNEPVFVRQIAKDVARIKNVSFEEVAQTTTQNAQKLFNI